MFEILNFKDKGIKKKLKEKFRFFFKNFENHTSYFDETIHTKFQQNNRSDFRHFSSTLTACIF